jgi:hypothetical protein
MRISLVQGQAMPKYSEVERGGRAVTITDAWARASGLAMCRDVSCPVGRGLLSQAWVGVDYKELPRKRDVPSSPFGRMGSHRAVGERALKDRPLFSVSHHHHS